MSGARNVARWLAVAGLVAAAWWPCGVVAVAERGSPLTGIPKDDISRGHDTTRSSSLLRSSEGAEESFGAAWAAEPEPLTLAACRQRVLAHYPLLQRRHASVEEALARQVEAAAGRWPRLTGTASMMTGDDPVAVFSTKLKQSSFTQDDFGIRRLNDPTARTNYQFGLQAEWPLFNAFQTIGRLRAAEHLTQAARHQSVFAEQEASLLVAEAYVGVILWDGAARAAEEALQQTRQDLEQAQALAEQGVILGADFYAAKVVAAGIEQAWRRAEAQRRIAVATLNVLMGEPPEHFVPVAGALPDEMTTVRPLAEWLATAAQRRADLAAARAAAEAQAAEARRERATALPSVSAVGSVETNTHDWSGGGDSYAVGLQGSVPLLDPARGARVRQQEEQVAQLRQDEAALRDAIAQAVTAAYEEQASVCALLPVAAQAADDAREATSLTEPLYREGRKSIADLVEIRQASLATRIGRDQLRAEAETGALRLAFLAGALDDAAVAQAARRLEAP